MDYTSLRQQGIRQLERLAGRRWTDFNVHDPGITILEQLCYALTDLGYRNDHEMPDLLANGGRDPYASLYPPGEILTTRAVTPTDLRKVALDVPGVKNAWIEPLGEELELHYHPGRREIGFLPDPPASEPVRVRGLYRVSIETSDREDIDGSLVRAHVARRLHAHRNLGEDFAEVRVLDPQKVPVRATVEIAPVEDAARLLAEIFHAIAAEISPSPSFLRLEDQLASGEGIDEILDGPPLDRGFLDDAILVAATRRTVLNTSDLVHAIMDVADVRAVRHLRLGESEEEWSLRLDPERAPRLDLEGSEIRLVRAGVTAVVDKWRAIELHTRRRTRASSTRGARGDTLAPPPGRDRRVERYHSIQHHFPGLYGIGPVGLPASTTPERKARGRQLEAYLMFFDQLLANSFAQLAHAGELFSFDGEDSRTYFAGRLEDPTLRLEVLRKDEEDHQQRVEEITENPDGPASSLERKNRFLSHLLARFAEQLTDYSLVLSEALPDEETGASETLARDKQAFLRNYPHVSSARGTAFSYLEPPGPGNVSGLEERIRRKLGLQPEEEMILIEHILLRPMEEDQTQTLPFLAKVKTDDPFSHELSFVFLETPRLEKPLFRQFIEHTVRDETPAHLVPRILWLDEGAWTELRDAWEAWLERRRELWKRKLGITESDHA